MRLSIRAGFGLGFGLGLGLGVEACCGLTRRHGRLHGDEAGGAAHELDQPDAAFGGPRLDLRRHQRRLRALHRRLEPEALVDLRAADAGCGVCERSKHVSGCVNVA